MFDYEDDEVTQADYELDESLREDPVFDTYFPDVLSVYEKPEDN